MALRLHRVAQNLRQRDLAERAGISRATVIGLEAGAHPRLTTAQAIAGVLGVPVEELFPDDERRPGEDGAVKDAQGDARHDAA
jgi:transcriptional regulator with XRE-family HTH domain